jgi:hypothetical protein
MSDIKTLRGRIHINDDRNSQCLKDEAAAGIREMIGIVLTNSPDVEAGKART